MSSWFSSYVLADSQVNGDQVSQIKNQIQDPKKNKVLQELVKSRDSRYRYLNNYADLLQDYSIIKHFYLKQKNFNRCLKEFVIKQKLKSVLEKKYHLIKYSSLESVLEKNSNKLKFNCCLEQLSETIYTYDKNGLLKHNVMFLELDSDDSDSESDLDSDYEEGSRSKKVYIRPNIYNFYRNVEDPESSALLSILNTFIYSVVVGYIVASVFISK
jgi:hypothetical protein